MLGLEVADIFVAVALVSPFLVQQEISAPL
jgi:hypothetical protein